MSSNLPSTAVIGLGAMGSGAARSILREGLPAAGFDMDAGKRAAFASEGGRAMAAPSDIADARVVVTFVATQAQVEDVLFGPGGGVEKMSPGSCLVQCATIPAGYAAELGERLAARGIEMVDAPVSGGPARAAEGKMTVMASGPESAFAIAQPVLDAMAERVWRVGDRHGQGSVVKTVNQLLAGVHIAASAEAMAFGIRAGVDPQVIYDVISTSAGSSWMFQNRVPHILNGDYTPLSAVDIFIKDLGIVLDSARKMTFPTPLAAQAQQMFTMAASAGLGREDDSAVIKIFEKLAGIPLPQGRGKDA